MTTAATYSIGIDGGGTKTDFILVDSSGKILAKQSTGGTNPSLFGRESVEEILRQTCTQLIAEAGIPHDSIHRTLLCMAGPPRTWKSIATNLKGLGDVTSVDDSIPVVQLAVGDSSGLAIHAGTGSFVAAKDTEGNLHYAGGLGWRMGDPGSGLDLGRRGMNQAFLELQGWVHSTQLTSELQNYMGITNLQEIMEKIYVTSSDPNKLIGRFAPSVVTLATGGLPEALHILTKSIAPIITLAQQVAQKINLPSTCRCGLSGRLLSSPLGMDLIKETLTTSSLQWDLRCVTEPPIEGIRQLLMSDLQVAQ
ncbi:MAG: ROK family protein [Opitutaceae bacterium]|nr:ROK family protein [Opitutaceae bacterium]